MELFALVKRYRGRQQIIAKGTVEYCEAQMYEVRWLARPVHTKNYPVSYFVLPTRKARAVKF